VIPTGWQQHGRVRVAVAGSGVLGVLLQLPALHSGQLGLPLGGRGGVGRGGDGAARCRGRRRGPCDKARGGGRGTGVGFGGNGARSPSGVIRQKVPKRRRTRGRWVASWLRLTLVQSRQGDSKNIENPCALCSFGFGVDMGDPFSSNAESTGFKHTPEWLYLHSIFLIGSKRSNSENASVK